MSDMTISRLRGYPFVLRMESGREIQRAWVVLAQHGEFDGLWAWQGSPDRLAFRGDVDWSATPPVTADASAMVPVHLTDGTVVEVRKGGACSTCGPMARWAGPEWSHTVAVRS